jgi:hypothetical protein
MITLFTTVSGEPGPGQGADLVRLMNADSGNPYRQIESLYWDVSHAAIRGVLDQIRTALTQLVAELRAASDDEGVPSADAADQAVQVVVTGKRSKVNVTTTQASGTGVNATTSAPQPGTSDSRFWTRTRTGAFVVGLATVAAAVFAAIEAF